MKAQKGGKSAVPPTHNIGATAGWVVSATLWASFTYCRGCWTGPGAGLERHRNSHIQWGSNAGPSSCTDYATPGAGREYTTHSLAVVVVKYPSSFHGNSFPAGNKRLLMTTHLYPSRVVPVPNQPPTQWVPGLFHGSKWAGAWS
jgi:hypothetical protein